MGRSSAACRVQELMGRMLAQQCCGGHVHTYQLSHNKYVAASACWPFSDQCGTLDQAVEQEGQDHLLSQPM